MAWSFVRRPYGYRDDAVRRLGDFRLQGQAPVVLRDAHREHLFQATSASDSARTSRQRNTHSIESREVCYTWHPWCGRIVAVHKTFARNGLVVSHCRIEENSEARYLEIPQWMFEPTICRRMQVAAVPTVSCEALRELKSLLQCALIPDTDVVLQAQHRCLSPGGADAKITASPSCSVHAVSYTAKESGLAEIVSRNKTESSETPCATATRAPRKSPHRQR